MAVERSEGTQMNLGRMGREERREGRGGERGERGERGEEREERLVNLDIFRVKIQNQYFNNTLPHFGNKNGQHINIYFIV